MPSPLRRRLLFSGGAFSPLSIAGLALWLDGSNTASLWQDTAATTPVTADAHPVGRANDLSGNGNHVTQATDTKRPLWKAAIQNGRGVLRFDGVDDFLAVTGLVNTSQTLYAVARPTALPANNNYQLNGAQAAGGYLYFGVGNEAGVIETYNYVASNTPLIASYSFQANTPYLWTLHGADGGAWALEMNGVQTATTGTSGAYTTNPTFRLGTGNATGNFAPIEIGEILRYQGDHDQATRAKVTSYLNAKWAIY